MSAFACGMMVAICMRFAISYEEYFNPKWGNPKVRGCILVAALWIFSLAVYVLVMGVDALK